MVAYRGENICPSCGKNHTKPSIFCLDCEAFSMEYYEVQISSSWAKRVGNTAEKDRFKECIAFSNRHKYGVDLVILKLKLRFDVAIILTSEEIYEIIDREG